MRWNIFWPFSSCFISVRKFSNFLQTSATDACVFRRHTCTAAVWTSLNSHKWQNLACLKQTWRSTRIDRPACLKRDKLSLIVWAETRIAGRSHSPWNSSISRDLRVKTIYGLVSFRRSRPVTVLWNEMIMPKKCPTANACLQAKKKFIRHCLG